MSGILKKVFIAIVGAASIVVLLAFAAFAYTKIDEALTVRVVNPKIAHREINHWQSGNKLLFATVIENKSDIEWEHVGVSFLLKKEDGSFFKRCETILFNVPLEKGPVDVEVMCPNMPNPMPSFTYEVEIIGEY